MRKYIDVQTRKTAIKEYGKSAINQGRMILDPIDDVLQIAELIDQLPAADVQEIQHGTWQSRRIDVASDDIYYLCSACGKTNDKTQPPYCPNCGAKMNGGNNE